MNGLCFTYCATFFRLSFALEDRERADYSGAPVVVGILTGEGDGRAFAERDTWHCEDNFVIEVKGRLVVLVVDEKIIDP